jgi:nucleoid DNA-binding protein
MGMEDDEDDAPAKRQLLTSRAFLERVAARGSLSPKQAKAAVEATLAALSEALAEGHDVTAPSLGKLKVVRERDKPKAKVLTIRLAMPRTKGDGDDE